MCCILCIQVSKGVGFFCGVTDDKITVLFQGQRVLVAKPTKKKRNLNLLSVLQVFFVKELESLLQNF